MPPDTPPPDDARRGPSTSPSSEGGGGNVVDPAVLAERRAQRAEQAEQSAARRAADAQVLAAQLARERARLEAERDAARAEAAAAREGADAAIAEARHLQAERDALQAALEQARAARAVAPPSRAGAGADLAPPAGGAAPASPARQGPGVVDGHGSAPAGWAEGLRRELALARAAAPSGPAAAAAAPAAGPSVPGLARERRLVAQRAGGWAGTAARPPAFEAQQRRGDRAAPITALTLERERSSRLQAQLDTSLEVQRELRTHIAALQRAVHQRVEAERRIETALRRVREELTAANAFAAGRSAPFGEPAGASALAQPAGAFAPAAAVAPAPAAPATAAGPPRAAAGTAAPSVVPMPPAPAASAAEPLAPPAPVAPAASAPADAPLAPPAPAASVPADAPLPSPVPAASAPADAPQPASPPHEASTPAPVVPASAPTPLGLDPLRLSAARERLRAAAPAAEPPAPLPSGPPAPWLSAALQRLLADDPDTAGRLAVGLLPALGLAVHTPLRCDVALAGRGTFAVDLQPGTPAAVVPRPAPRPRRERDVSLAADAVGLAKLLHGRRSPLRRPARVRGGRSAKRELRRAAQAPLGLRDLGAAGVALEPALALRLVALAIDPAATQGERFAVAHAPLAGGPVDAWLRIADGAPPAIVTRQPAEPTRLTLRCTRGALLALIAGVDPAPGESGTLDGDDRALALLRGWIAETERPGA